MKRITILLLTASLFVLSANAQAWRHEVAIKGGGGLSSLQYDPSSGEQIAGSGYMFGLGYTYFFTPNWGIVTGAEMGYYNSKGVLTDFTSNVLINLNNSTSFDFIATYGSYQETVKTMLVNIPIMVQYQSPSLDNKSLYVSLGAKLGIPVWGRSNISGTLTTAGYFPDTDVTLRSLPDQGFVDELPINHKSDLDLKVAVLASCEVGVKWKLGEKTNLYSGLYLDYGLNDISEAKKPLVNYQPESPTVFKYSTMGNSLSNNVTPLTVGLSLKFSFGLSKFAAKKPVAPPTA